MVKKIKSIFRFYKKYAFLVFEIQVKLRSTENVKEPFQIKKKLEFVG